MSMHATQPKPLQLQAHHAQLQQDSENFIVLRYGTLQYTIPATHLIVDPCLLAQVL